MDSSEELQRLTDTEHAWALQSELLWREAYAIAAANPGVDAGDVYHALRCFGFPPAERLRRGRPVFDIVLTAAERALFEALDGLGVRYIIVGMSAALIEGALRRSPLAGPHRARARRCCAR